MTAAAQHTPGLQVHLAQYKCGVRARTIITAVNDEEVTCRRCLAAMSRPQQSEIACRVCGTPRADHGSYPTCASHPYTPDENCRYVIGARCLGAECNARGCVRGAKATGSAA